MKKFLLIVLSLMFFAAVFASAEDEGFLGEWKRKAASPTYGIAIMPFMIEKAGGNDIEDLFLPGLDLRIFQGTNVSKRGGFFTGIEVGTLLFFTIPDSEISSFSDSYTDTAETYTENYTITTDYSLAMVFLMAKYGYRMDLGFSLIGISAGAEIGIGARIGAGHMGLSTMIDEQSADWGMGADSMSISPILDAAVEAAIRLGKNFRIIGRLGCMLTPPMLEGGDTSSFWAGSSDLRDSDGDAGGADTWSYSEIRSLLSRYGVESSPLIPTARLGFILNF